MTLRQGDNLDKYGIVLLFATSIGIVGQLRYVKQRLKNFYNYNTKSPCRVPALLPILPPTILIAAVSLREYTYEQFILIRTVH